MKIIFIYSRAYILICSILLTGIFGSLLMSHHLRKLGKSRLTGPFILLVFFINLLLVIFVNYLIPSPQWNLNKTVGWGWEIPYFLRPRNLPYEYFIPNIILGLTLAFPVWNKYFAKFPKYDNNKP
jgi:hypothetical protein